MADATNILKSMSLCAPCENGVTSPGLGARVCRHELWLT
jgi:hypothetical protein